MAKQTNKDVFDVSVFVQREVLYERAETEDHDRDRDETMMEKLSEGKENIAEEITEEVPNDPLHKYMTMMMMQGRDQHQVVTTHLVINGFIRVPGAGGRRKTWTIVLTA